ncbi:DNA-directed RNA polymerase subunit beta [Virgibacillus xinjiangensis]|uniref:DNA-directed RNA polymerase subunit beta n=1 Tax=Virgibacillus xinjiangensis TaxID=393090 RepID=A0ABV7CW16_9BACI
MPNNQSEQQSRKSYKQSKKKQPEKKATDAKSRKEIKQQKKAEKLASQPRRRVFPIWLRIIVVILLAAIALIAGLMIGYSVLGDGNPLEILRAETWEHIYDIVFQGNKPNEEAS